LGVCALMNIGLKNFITLIKTSSYYNFPIVTTSFNPFIKKCITLLYSEGLILSFFKKNNFNNSKDELLVKLLFNGIKTITSDIRVMFYSLKRLF